MTTKKSMNFAEGRLQALIAKRSLSIMHKDDDGNVSMKMNPFIAGLVTFGEAATALSSFANLGVQIEPNHKEKRMVPVISKCGYCRSARITGQTNCHNCGAGYE